MNPLLAAALSLCLLTNQAFAGQGGQTGWTEPPPRCGWLRGGVWSCANPSTASGEPSISAANYMFILTCEQQNDRSFCDRERARILREPGR